MLEMDFNTALERTATELLREICLYLDPASLRAFTTVSKRCCSVSRGLLFRIVHIRVASRKQLRMVTEDWTRKLDYLSCFNEVARLNIDGTMPSKTNDNGQYSVLLFEGDCFRSIADDRSASETINDDSAWEPLAAFIRQLPHLRDIYYTCTNQVSPCLLSAMHQCLPECRLHLQSFKLRATSEPDFEHHEFALATSPNLYSISSRLLRDSLEEDAFQQTIARLAPNLKKVSIGSLSSEASPDDFLHSQPGRRKVWPGFAMEKPKLVDRRASLTSLILSDDDDLSEWSNLVDLAALHTLQLGMGYRCYNRDALSWSVMHSPFQSLQALQLEFDLGSNDHADDGLLEMFDSFLSSLPPLVSLKLIVNPFKENQFTSVLDHHGTTLRQLHLDTTGHLSSIVFRAKVIDSIRQKCPLLEDLKLVVPRSKGDEEELAIYRAVGAIPRLQILALILDCTNRTIWRRLPEDAAEVFEILNDASFDEYDQSFVPEDRYNRGETPRNGHVRDALINSALDERLACSIFRRISAGKSAHGIRVQCLKLCIYGGGFFGEPDQAGCRLPVAGLKRVIDQIGISWQVERSIRDDCPEQLKAHEISHERYGPGSLLMDMIYNDASVLTPQMEPVLRKLWPASNEASDDWRKDWHSFPLLEF